VVSVVSVVILSPQPNSANHGGHRGTEVCSHWLNITLPDSLAKKAAELAEKEQISLDQFVSLAVAEKMSAWLTEGYVAERAKRGDRAKFLKALRGRSSS